MNPIVIKELIGANAISMNSGRKIREEILLEWNNSEKIILEFSEVEVFASPFFNSSIGALLKNKKISELQEKLVFNGISEHGRRLLNLVIDNAIKFYSDSENRTSKGLNEIKKEI